MIRTAICHSLPVLLLASAGLAQTQWNNAAGGAWNLAANWDPSDVPDMPDESASIDLAGTYTVVLSSLDPSILGLSITNPNATLGINGAETLSLGAGLLNDGLIVVDFNSSSAATAIDFLTDTTIGGAGLITLNQTADRAQILSSTGAVVTNGANHTIDGRGRIRAAMINDGLISANWASSTLELRDTDKTNNALMEAVNGGILELVSVAVNQGPGGVVRADGSTVRVSSSSVVAINDGTVETINDGLVLVLSGGELTLHDVSLSGALDINGGGVVRVTGSTLTNDALIRVDANSSSAAGVLEFSDSIDLNGTGTIQLVQTVFRSQLNTGDGATLTHGANHTIRGRGYISAALVNDGSIIADVPSSTLEIRDNDKTNNALIQALDGGILQLVDGVLTQAGAGAIVADAGTVRIDGSGTPTVVGGSIEALNDGTVEVFSGGVLSLDSVQNQTTINVNGGGTVRSLGGGFTNNGVLEINANNSTSAGFLIFGANGTVDGSGVISLPRVAARSTLTSEDGVVGTIGAGQRVTGTGQLDGDLRLEGTVAPGNDGIGEMRLEGNLEMQPSGSLEVEFSSLSQFDELTGPGSFSAGGTLAATNTSGGAFDPVFGDSFVVVAAAGGLSDRFDAVTGPSLPGVLEWRVRYEPTQAVLIVSCDGDANLDGVINTLDVLGFLNLWTAGDPRADITGDGNINTLDVLAFLNAWTAGC